MAEVAFECGEILGEADEANADPGGANQQRAHGGLGAGGEDGLALAAASGGAGVMPRCRPGVS